MILSGCTNQVSRSVLTNQPVSGCEEKHGYCITLCEHEHTHSKINREKCYQHCKRQLNSCRKAPSRVVINPQPSVVVKPYYAPVVVEPYPYWGWGYAGGYYHHYHHWR